MDIFLFYHLIAWPYLARKTKRYSNSASSWHQVHPSTPPQFRKFASIRISQKEPPWKLTYPLKIHGWRWSFQLKWSLSGGVFSGADACFDAPPVLLFFPPFIPRLTQSCKKRMEKSIVCREKVVFFQGIHIRTHRSHEWRCIYYIFMFIELHMCFIYFDICSYEFIHFHIYIYMIIYVYCMFFYSKEMEIPWFL